MKTLKTFKQKVYSVVQKIPKGQTLSYKEVAIKTGHPKAYRAVGNVLSQNTHPEIIPCHRVIKSNGKIGGYKWGEINKKNLLKKENFIK